MLAKRYYDDVASLKRSFVDPFGIFDDYGKVWDLMGPTHLYSSADFYRTEKTDTGMSLSIDLPGVKGSDLDVTLEGRTVKIKGNQRGKQVSYTYLISKEYDPATIDAALQDGVLTLNFSRSPELEPKKVEIKVIT